MTSKGHQEEEMVKVIIIPVDIDIPYDPDLPPIKELGPEWDPYMEKFMENMRKRKRAVEAKNISKAKRERRVIDMDERMYFADKSGSESSSDEFDVPRSRVNRLAR